MKFTIGAEVLKGKGYVAEDAIGQHLVLLYTPMRIKCVVGRNANFYKWEDTASFTKQLGIMVRMDPCGRATEEGNMPNRELFRK